MYTFEDLKQIMKTLRAEDGCPWDRAQDHETLKKHLVEECAEVLEAIDAHDTENLCEELGDVLFQVMFHSEIEAEQGNFTVDDVVNGICEKMIREGPLGSDQETGAGGKEKTGRRTLTKSAQKHGKNGQKSLTKNAETYINVRVQCKGPSGRLCPRVLK